ncbi:uncharacterized protein LOC129607567 [Condylostylus longicornis]|uniref:uncharacterized protein LOC129607567 n=1 Tax=Condylostylus longicornis TaxID=2530218 RepID=UPI00244DB031|nr:uncharacterized protein LOC129607567 [Condylostylus longicornis]
MLLRSHFNAIAAKWLSTIILYDSQNPNELQSDYLEGISEFQRETGIVTQVIDAKGMNQSILNEKLLAYVELAADGFISILPEPSRFLAARTYAAQKSIQRIKDKYHLYLQDEANVEDFFESEDLDLFPWHIMEPGKGNTDSLNTVLFKKDLNFFGSEANICIELCLIWNCTLKVKNYGQDAWGELYENGTSSGIVGGVWKKEVEFGIGSIYNWYNYEFEVANGIAKSAVHIMGPAPKRLPQYLTPILPLSFISWIILIITIGICSITLNNLRYSAMRLKNPKQSSYKVEVLLLSFLDIFAMFVQQSYSKVKYGIVITLIFIVIFGARLLIGATLFTALTMENIYSGQLKSLLTIPLFENPIDTTEKFAKMNWKWGAPAVAWEDTIEESEIPKEKILAKNFEVHSVDELKKLTYTGVWGFAVEKLHSGGYTFNDYIVVDDKVNLILVQDYVFYEFTRFIAIRGWPLKERLNFLVLWVFESGIYIHWETSYTRKYIDPDVLHYMVQLEHKFVPKPEQEPLNISHVSGPIFALILGYILSVLVFVCEILAVKVYSSGLSISMLS